MTIAQTPSRSAVSRVMGAAFSDLPAEVRAVHSGAHLQLSGSASADLGHGFVKAMICAVFGFPRPGASQTVTIAFSTDAKGVDHWQRNFAGRRYSSTLQSGTAARSGCLVERQGILTSVFTLLGREDRLEFRLTGFALFGVSLPRWFSPRCVATETGRDGAFTFDISVDLPLIGRLIHYWGWLLVSSGQPG